MMTERQRIIATSIILAITFLTTGAFLGAFVPLWRCTLEIEQFVNQDDPEALRQQANRIVMRRAISLYMNRELEEFILSEAPALTVEHWCALLGGALEYHDDELFEHLLTGMSRAKVDHNTVLEPFAPKLDSLPLSAKLTILTWLDYGRREQVEASRSALEDAVDGSIKELLSTAELE